MAHILLQGYLFTRGTFLSAGVVNQLTGTKAVLGSQLVSQSLHARQRVCIITLSTTRQVCYNVTYVWPL